MTSFFKRLYKRKRPPNILSQEDFIGGEILPIPDCFVKIAQSIIQKNKEEYIGLYHMKGGGGTNTVVQNSQPPAAVLDAYKNVLSQAQNTSAQPLTQYQGPNVAPLTQTQNTALSTINQAQGIAAPYIGAGAQYLGAAAAPLSDQVQGYSPDAIQQYMSPYTQQVVDATRANLNENNAQQQLGIAGNAIKAGAYGGDRAGIASAELARQQKLADDQTIANLYGHGFDQAQGQLNTQQQLQLQEAQGTAGNRLQAGAGIANLGTTAENTALQGANIQLQGGALQQQQAQEFLNVPYQQFEAQQQYPYQATQYLANIAEGIGGSSGGTSSTTSPGPSGTSQLAGLGLGGLAFAGGLGALAQGGRVGYAEGGTIPGAIDMNVPDVSLSVVPVGAPMPGRMGPPAPPKQAATPSASDQHASVQTDIDAMKGARQLGKYLKGSTGTSDLASSGPFSLSKDTFTTPGNSILTQGLSPTGDVSNISPAISDAWGGSGGIGGTFGLDSSGLQGIGSDLTASNSVLPAGFSLDGTTALADAATTSSLLPSISSLLPTLGASWVADAALPAAMSEAGLPAFLAAFFLKDGGTVPSGIAAYADGGDVSDDSVADPATDSDSQIMSLFGDGAGISPKDSASSNEAKPDKWEALLAAGLGMMSGQSPYAGVNIGAGGLEGLKDWQQQKKSSVAAQRLADQSEKWKEYLAVQQQKADQGHYVPDQMGRVLNTKTGEYINHGQVPNGTGVPNIDPETGDITSASNQSSFGFDTSNIPPKVFSSMAAEDSKRRQADISNLPITGNVNRILDQLEPNLEKFPSGGSFKGNELWVAKNLHPSGDFSTSGANIDKGTNDLATELNKFQYIPGMRGSVLGLQTILASKPGVEQPPQTNKNIISSLRAKVNDYALTGELAQQYREASPLKITDQNTYKLDDALKSIYPLETVDKKTGNVTYNADNVDKIRQAIPDAIANPKKYFALARKVSVAPSGAPTAAAAAHPTEQKIATQADIAETAQKSGMTAQQVTQKLIAKGFKIQ